MRSNGSNPIFCIVGFSASFAALTRACVYTKSRLRCMQAACRRGDAGLRYAHENDPSSRLFG